MNIFRTKPAEVQAARWDGTAQGATPIIEWALSAGVTAGYVCSDIERCAENDGDAPHWLKLDVPGRQFFVHIGEWLVRNEHGEFDRYSNIAFEATFDQVRTDSETSPPDRADLSRDALSHDNRPGDPS